MSREHMRRLRAVKCYFYRNRLLILLACVVQFKLTECAILVRGGFSVGGEVLVLPAFLMAWEMIRRLLRGAVHAMERKAGTGRA